MFGTAPLLQAATTINDGKQSSDEQSIQIKQPTKVNNSSDSSGKKLNDLLASLETFQANFEQIITTENGEELDKLSGLFYLQKPGKFHWEVTQPFSQLLIADGQYLWQYDEDLEQAMVRDLDQSLGGTPAQLLSGTLTQLENSYQIEYQQQKPQIERFRLIPKDEGQFESIQLQFNQGALSKLTLVDTLGQTTNVLFSNAKFGMALPATLFTLKLQKGVELVDSRKTLLPQQ